MPVPSYDFGSGIVSVAGAPVSFSVVNQGPGSVQIGSSAVQVSGANAADFSVSQPAPTTLAGGASVSFSITFTPSSAAAESATVKIVPAAGASSVSLGIGGTGIAFGVQSAAGVVTSQDFGTATVSTTTDAVTFTVYNEGSTTLDLAASSDSSDFPVGALSASSVAPGGNATFTVTFDPTTYGTRSGNILVQDAGQGASYSFSVGGTGSSGSYSLITDWNGNTLAGGQAIDFGTVTMPTSKSLTIHNSAGTILYFLDQPPSIVVNGGSSAFTISIPPLAGPVAAGGTQQFSINLGSGVPAGTYTGTLTIHTSDSSSSVVSYPLTMTFLDHP